MKTILRQEKATKTTTRMYTCFYFHNDYSTSSFPSLPLSVAPQPRTTCRRPKWTSQTRDGYSPCLPKTQRITSAKL